MNNDLNYVIFKINPTLPIEKPYFQSPKTLTVDLKSLIRVSEIANLQTKILLIP